MMLSSPYIIGGDSSRAAVDFTPLTCCMQYINNVHLDYIINIMLYDDRPDPWTHEYIVTL